MDTWACGNCKAGWLVSIGTYVIEAGLQVLELALFNYQVILIVQVLHNVVMALLVVLKDHGFDRGIALDEET